MAHPLYTPKAPPRHYRKMVLYSRTNKDFAMYLNGELVGYAATYLQAESTLNQLVYELLKTPADATRAGR